MSSQDRANQGRPDDALAHGEVQNVRRRREDSDVYAQEQRRAEDFRVLQTRALELAAEDRPLREALDELMRTVEARSSTGVLGSVLLVDKDGKHLVHGAGPSLPAAYNAAIDGIDIGTGVGSCGTAAAENRPVHVSDIAVDPLWTDFRDLALSHGLRACWSTPIRSRGGDVLGTFAMYYSRPREPSPTDLATVDVVTRAAALLIERRRTIAALADSEERLRLAVDNAEIGFWDVDLVHDLLMWPPRTKAMFGISPEVPVSMADFYAGVHPEDVDATTAAFLAAADPARRALYDAEYRTVGKEDRRVRWVAAKGRGVFNDAGRCLRVVGTAIDITARKRIEAELRRSEGRLLALNADLERQVIERTQARGRSWAVSPDLMGALNAGGYFETSNPAWQTLLGWSEEEMRQMSIWALLHPDDLESTRQGFALTQLGQAAIQFPNRYRRKDGTYRWISWVGVPEDGMVYCTGRDITVEKEREAELAASRAERDRMWEMSPDLLAVIDFDGVFRRVNPAWKTILGRGREDLVGTRFDRLIHPDDLAVTEEALVHASGGPLPIVENRYRHMDGSYRWISWITPSPENGLIFATGRHVTAEKERQAELEAAQEALRQSQKMEAVGQLTGGIAHDFNNMLAVVIGSLDLLNRRIGDGDARAKRYVDAAAEGARRAALLTQRLLAFSRQQPLKPEALDANKLVSGMSDLLHHSLGGDVRLETVLAAGLWRIHADPNQLESLILNLAINGRDAMVDGGRLTIETANCHLDARYAAAHFGVAAGQYVLVAVTDTGSGMSPEVVAKAFDPFFTTKQVGKGTGLGLSQVYGFVKQSGGHVKIYSEPGQGTTIKVYLPRLIGAETEQVQGAIDVALPLGESQEAVLVVEDEPAVRQFSVDALTELGYRVLEADGAAAALRLLDAHPEIALMFTDIVMPEVNGAKLAAEAKRRRPDLRVLFTTGYTRNAVVHNGVLDAGVELIGKPFTLEELAAKVRAVLDEPL